jgi:hypothetical protein
MNAVVRISAAVAVVVLTIGACMFVAADFEHRSLPRDFKSPVLAMEMARSMDEVKAIVGEPGNSDRSQMRSQQRMDFLFIVAYWSEFLLIGVLLWHRNFSLARPLALIAWLCATLAAGLDVRENVGILGVLSAPPRPDYDPLVQAVRFAATSKWLLLFVAMVLLSFVFIGRRDKRAGNGIIFFLPGLFFLVTGIVGLAGLWWNVLLNCVALLMLFGLRTLVVALFRSPSRLLHGL